MPKPPSGKEEVDKGKEPAKTSHEKDTTTAADAEPPKDVPKPTEEEVSNFFGKMFKKKAEPGKAASENKDSIDGQVTAVDEKSVSRNGNTSLFFNFALHPNQMHCVK